jgi:hypothetical protein
MKICIESTTKTVLVNDVPVRVWEGYCEKEQPLIAYVIMVQPKVGVDRRVWRSLVLDHEIPSKEVADLPPEMML